MKKDNDRREYYKLYHQSKMNDPGYAGKSYREKRREMAREYANSHKERREEIAREMAKDPNYVENRRKYLKVWRAKNKEHIREYNKTREPWVFTTKQRFSHMLYHAKERNFATTLTFEEYENLIKLPCYLCGEPVVSAYGGHGIDRLDNSIGYTLSNCRSCCGACNTMKSDLSIEDFITRIKKILQNYNKVEKKR